MEEVISVLQRAALTELEALLILAHNEHGRDKVRLRTAWRPLWMAFKDRWPEHATLVPSWLAQRIEAVMRLR